MPINLLLYISVTLVLLQSKSLENVIFEQVVNGMCVIGIATVGVAHGAIDDILHGSGKGRQRLFFILKYLAAIVLFGTIWFVSSNLAFFIFLSTSAFHFGQTQLTGLNIKSKGVAGFLFFLWGSFVILCMFAFNKELLLETNYDTIFVPELYYHIVAHAEIYLIIVSSIIPIVLIGLSLKRAVSMSVLLREFFLLFLIAWSFLVLEPFVAFSIFFILIHSSQALHQEYEFCKKEKIAKNALQFVSLFLPLTIGLLVIVGVFLYALIYFKHADFIPIALIILLSCVTIPHCFVMDQFYKVRND